jgi:hypothetical protein
MHVFELLFSLRQLLSSHFAALFVLIQLSLILFRLARDLTNTPC